MLTNKLFNRFDSNKRGYLTLTPDGVLSLI